ncbi:hypothetical protein P4O66_008908 [Electrophorus voltai]|uniref:Uncharacterized protein n=1 Tax=Electrophorus voltai TaxID=2609070 RepID=A0AAD9DX98_9TELE|nr:hypothetical protein P4O66_008908 [Electrophorus voltai]
MRGVSVETRVRTGVSGVSVETQIRTGEKGVSVETRVRTGVSGVSVETRIRTGEKGVSVETRVRTGVSGVSVETRIRTEMFLAFTEKADHTACHIILQEPENHRHGVEALALARIKLTPDTQVSRIQPSSFLKTGTHM